MTQLMENNNSHRPIPATEEIMAKLPREVLMEGCKSSYYSNNACLISLMSSHHTPTGLRGMQRPI